MKSRALAVAILFVITGASIAGHAAAPGTDGSPPSLEIGGVRRIRTLTPRPWLLPVMLAHPAGADRGLEVRAVRLRTAGGELVEEVALAAAAPSEAAPGSAPGRAHAWIRFDPSRFGSLTPGSTLRASLEADYESGGLRGTVSAPYAVAVEPWQMPPVPEGAHHSGWYIGNTHVHSLDFSSCDGKYSAHLSISRDGTSPVDSTGGFESPDSELETLAWNQGLRWINVSEHCYCFACAEYCAVGEREGPCRHNETPFRQTHTCKVARQTSFGPGSVAYGNYERFYSIVQDQNSNQAPETFLTIAGIELTAQDAREDCGIRDGNHMHLTGFGMRHPQHGGLVGCPIDSYNWHGLTGGFSFNADFGAAEGIRRLRTANPYGLAILNHVEGFGAAFLAIHGTSEETLACTGKIEEETETGWELISTAVTGVTSAQKSDPIKASRKWVEHRLNHGYRSVAYGAADFHYFWDNDEPRDETVRNYERLGDAATVVYADSLSQDDIGKALRNGQTFATTGPGLAVFACKSDEDGECIGPWAWMGEYLQTGPGDRLKVLVSYSASDTAGVILYAGAPDPDSVRQFDGVVEGRSVAGSGTFERTFQVTPGDPHLVYFRAVIRHEKDSTKTAYTTPLWIKVGSPRRGSSDHVVAANFDKNRCISRIDYLQSLPPYPVAVEAECTGLNLPDADDPGSQPPRLDFDPNCSPENCGGCCDERGRCRKGNQTRSCGNPGETCTDCTRLARDERSCVTTPGGNVCGCSRDSDCFANRDGRECSPITGGCGCVDDGDCPAGRTCDCGRFCSPLFPGVCVP